MTSGTRRRDAASCLVIVAGVVAMVVGAAPATAHVTGAVVENGSRGTTVSFRVTHGCGASPTQALKVRLPSGTVVVGSQEPPGWRRNDTPGQLDWFGTPVPHDQELVVAATLQLPPESGGRIAFPAVQTCEAGELAWIEPLVDGRPEPEHPTPVVDLAATGGVPAVVDHASHDAAASAPAAGSGVDGMADPWVVAATAVIAVLLVGVLTAVVLRRRERDAIL